MSRKNHQDIRLGTKIDGKHHCDEFIRQILPYGFECFQLSWWEQLGDIDLSELAPRVMDVLAGSGATITCLGIYGNPLGDQPVDEACRESWRQSIDHAHAFGADMVCGFAGRVRHQPLEASLPRFREVFGELSKRAADKGVRLAFENCPMGGNWKSGDWNIAFNPMAWEMMFDALPEDNLGLEWEPAHPVEHLIDPLPQLRRWVGKVFHVHGKDATVDRAMLAEQGYHGKKWSWGRHPGFGETNWTDVISILRQHGYTGAINIEGFHDPVYRDDLEMTGQVAALNYLKACRGGKYVPNPVIEDA